MSVFEPVNFNWQGVDYSIPSTSIMRLIAGVEDIITLQEMAVAASTGKVKMARIAQAFAFCLRFAGAKVEDEEVYASMFNVRDQHKAISAVQTLLLMMIPKDLKPSEVDKASVGKHKPTVRSSSSRPTRRRSGKGG